MSGSKSAVGSKTELLNVLGDVKARVQDKLGIVDFPMPQFILIGKQSVGKSRLIEALAGETFNFISGTLGSRRPTVLEFRNVAGCKESRWSVRNPTTNHWEEHSVAKVMQLVGQRHEELGETVSPEPIYVRIESAGCVDMQIVDLPGFRDFALDSGKQDLADKIDALDETFMRDKRNVMLCVEQAADAATMSTLQRCRKWDQNFERTVLIRNKLDKYYSDLTMDNVNKWIEGYGELPENLARFALTLPFWRDGAPPPKSFNELKEDMNAEDLRQMQSKGLSAKYMQSVGFKAFASFMELKIESMFVEAIGPVLSNLKDLKISAERTEKELDTEYSETDPHRILSTTRDCGVSFATALTHVMEGVLDLKPVMNLEDELNLFHSYHQALGSNHFNMLPSEDFCGLGDYISYLRDEIKIATFDVEVNGGAQFRRLMNEVEIFLRFSEIAVETRKRDVIQARGVSMSSLTWRDVVVKLLSNEAHLPLQRRVQYVGERIRWFFENQKEAVLEFMDKLEGTPNANLYSPLYPKHAKLIKQNEMIKHLVFQTYDAACKRQLGQFVELFDNMLTSTFSNPWVFLKGATTGGGDGEDLQDAVLPSFDDTKERIPKEILNRSGTEATLSKWLTDIPTESGKIDEAVDKVQMLVLKTYSFIRSQVCDQVELFSESFFKLPMMRRLEEDMALIELSEEDTANYEARRDRLHGEINKASDALVEVNACIERLQNFKLKCEARGRAV
jgi:GTP-binding protein EngB required for normal cell division|mmetsp:Transcript_39399/g.116838  ORF Transcript_39399/g.116838 Transcript_39399/m.116838 type:complete len:733 (-) Transcript_39399:181-2379(-)